jgi:DNA gyrase subunit B
VLNVEKARYDKLISSEQIVTLITALGTSIGPEFDASKIRYHRIIIMTDADVDGAHIRTLLLTLLYRQMPEIIERGYVYIAQPPLYKIKHGKQEMYIKDEHALDQHMLSLALDGASLTPKEGAAAIEGNAFGELARDYLLSEAIIRRLTDFIEPEVMHALLANDINIDVSSEAAAKESAEKLAAVVSSEIAIKAYFDPQDERWEILIEKFRHGNLRVGNIDEDFLRGGDWQQIRKTSALIAGLVDDNAVVRRGEKSAKVKSFADAITWLLAEVERGLSKQRYKGLGEMNPEQLWETTMDPNVRRLLKVQIDDAIAADEIFTTLMGDDVEPRRAFIESNALYAKNIDV